MASRRRLAWLAVLTFSAPVGAAAQVAWDVPAMMRPGAPGGLSILLLEPYPGDDFGVLAMWRRSAAPAGIGLRGGLADDPAGDLAAFFGLDISGSLGSLGSGSQPSVLWWSGAGLGVGDEALISFPLGAVIGWSISEESVSFAPYVGGHLVLDAYTGPGDDLDLDGSLDLGVDLGFGSDLMVRFGAALADRDAFALGLRLPT